MGKRDDVVGADRNSAASAERAESFGVERRACAANATSFRTCASDHT
jgi:hypothetical protein